MHYDKLNIEKIDLFRSPIKLKEPFTTSLGRLDYSENVVVKIQTREGVTGWGECNPFPSINGETMETGMIVGKLLAVALTGANPLDPGSCMAIMDKAIFGNSSIKSAFDIAIYDIASQNAGKPLYEFLGGTKAGRKLITDYTVSIGDPEKMAADAVRIVERGFSEMKVKLGGGKDIDIKRIQHIRNAIGLSIPIRIDANQGWNKTEAIEVLRALEPFNIRYCEEPIPRWSFMDLSEVKGKSPIPVMADESCCDHHDAQRLVDIGACTHFNIKLGKSSGIYKALKIIEIAEKNNITLQIGGFLESRLPFTASAHLALVSKNVKFVDFDTPLMFSEDPIEGGITYGLDWEVIVPEVPGLGAKWKGVTA